MQTYVVNLTETYKDGTEWRDEMRFTASRPDVAAKEALSFNRRSRDLSGHGPVTGMTLAVRRDT